MTPDDVRLAAACRDPGRTVPFAIDASAAPDPAADPALGPVLAQAVHASRASIVVTDAALDAPGPRIVYANPAFEAMTGYRAADVVGRDPRMLQGRATSRALLDRLRADLERDGRFEGEGVNYRADGTPFVMSWRIAAVTDASGAATHYVAIQDDVTDDRVRAADASVLVADLQRLGLPQVPERVGPLEVAVGYRPAHAGLPIGGDWYDAVESDGAVVLVVGDVAGSGAESVVTMGMLRWTIAALLAAGEPLPRVAEVAHRAASSARVHASVAAVRVEAGGGEVQVLTAGHPPVLFVGDDGAARPVLTPNPMLGVGRPPAWEVASTTMAPGDTVILLTDGVVDGGRVDVDAIPSDVMRRIGAARSPAALRDALLATTPDGDDAAVITATLPVASTLGV